MSDIYIPPELQWVSYLAGDKWPQGSETGMLLIDKLCLAAAEALVDLLPDLSSVRAETLSVLIGETAEIADEHFRMLFDGDYAVDKLADAIKALGEAAAHTGSEIEYSKLSIIVGLALAAGEILYSLAMSGPTWGASLAWIPITEALTILAFRQLISFVLRRLFALVRRMLTRTMVKQLAREIPQEAVEELTLFAVQEATVAGLQGDRYRPNVDRLVLGATASTIGGGAGGGFAVPTSHLLGHAHTRAGAAGKGLLTMGIAGFGGNIVGQASVGQNPFDDPLMLVTSSAMTSVGGARGAGVQTAPPRTRFTHPPGPGSPPPGLPPINGDRNGGWAPRGGDGANWPASGRVPDTIGQGYGDLTPRGGDGANWPIGQPVANTAPHVNDIAGQQDSSTSLATPTSDHQSTTDDGASQTGPSASHADADDLSQQSSDGAMLSSVDITDAGSDNRPIPGSPVVDTPDLSTQDGPTPIGDTPIADTPVDPDLPPVTDAYPESRVEAATDRSTTTLPSNTPPLTETPGPAAANPTSSPSGVHPPVIPKAQAPSSSQQSAPPSTPAQASTASPRAAAPKQAVPKDVSASPTAAAESQVVGAPAARLSDTTAARAQSVARDDAAETRATVGDVRSIRPPVDPTGPPTGRPVRTDTPNCGAGAIQFLSGWHERKFGLGVDPTSEGVPARAVFGAVNSRADFTTFADAAATLLDPDVESGSSAVLTWSWAGDGGRRGGHTAVLIKDGDVVYLYDPHTNQHYEYDPKTQQFTGYWGQDAISQMAVGYLKPNGDAVKPLDGSPTELTAADEIGHVQGLPGTGSDPTARQLADAALDRREPSLWGKGLVTATGRMDTAVGARGLVNPLGQMDEAVARAQANALWWNGLTGEDGARMRQALIDTYPIQIGNSWGIDGADRANRLALEQARVRADRLRSSGHRLTSGQQKFVERVDQIEAGLREVDEAAERAGLTRPRLLAFDPTAFRSNGHAVISFGADPYRAEDVSWQHIRQPIDELGEALVRPALGQLQSSQGDPRSKARLVWIGKGKLTSRSASHNAVDRAFNVDKTAFAAARVATAEPAGLPAATDTLAAAIRDVDSHAGDPAQRLVNDALNKRIPPVRPQDLVNRLGPAERSAARAHANALWWQRLSDAEQQLLIERYPYSIGNAEGITPDDRHAANERVWQRAQRIASELRSKLRNGQPLTADERKFLRQVSRIDVWLRYVTVAAEEAGVGAPRLLAFDPLAFDGDGHLVISFGANPYETARVSWHLVRQPIDQLTETLIDPALDQLPRDVLWTRSAAAILFIGSMAGPAWSAARHAFFTGHAAFHAARDAQPTTGTAQPFAGSVQLLGSPSPAADLSGNILWVPPDADPRVLGHRGAAYEYPEQTLAAIEEAIRQGALGVEIDARLSADGHFVCMHDGRVDRTSDGTGRVGRMNVDQMAELDYGSWHHSRQLGEAQGDTGLLRLDRLLEVVVDNNRPFTVFVDIKKAGMYGWQVERALVALLQQYGLANPASLDQCYAAVMSTYPEGLRLMRRLAPHLPMSYSAVGSGLLSDTPLSGVAQTLDTQRMVSGFLRTATWAGANAVGFDIQQLRANPELASRAAELGLATFCGVGDRFDPQFLRDVGVRWIIADHPGRTINSLGLERGGSDASTAPTARESITVASSDTGTDQPAADHSAPAVDDQPARTETTNCGAGAVKFLAGHHRRPDIALGVPVTSEGVQARAVFKAVNSRADFTTFADAAEALLDPSVEPGSSAVLAWSWAGDGGRRGGHTAVLVKDDEGVYLYDPHTQQRHQYDPGTRQFTGYFGQDAVSQMAVGFLEPNGDAVNALDGSPTELAAADEIGHVQGLPDPDWVVANDALGERLPPVPVGKLAHPIGKPEAAVGLARNNVEWLKQLADGRTAEEMRDLITALINTYPNTVGNTDGFLPMDRDAGIREYLRRVEARAQAKLYGDQRLSDYERKAAERANRIGLAKWQLDFNAERVGVGEPKFLAFDHREFGGDGRAVISFGDDPYHADEVVWLIARQPVDEMGSVVSPAAEHLRQMRAAAPGKRVAVIVWMGNTTLPVGSSYNAFYSDLAAFRAVRGALAETGDATPLTGNRVHALRPASTTETAQANNLWLQPDSDLLVFAHRGGLDLLAENTLPAFRLALEQGANALECDIQLSKDGQLVVIHDPFVNRSTEGSGFVSNMTAAQLNELGVPTLEQLLRLAKNHNKPVTVFIEVKHYAPKDNWKIERTLVNLLRRHGLANPAPSNLARVAVTSTSPRPLKEVRRLAPTLPTVLLASQLPNLGAVRLYISVAKRVGANAISFFKTLRAFPEAVDLAHRQGLNVWAGVVHNAIEAQYLVDLGAEIIGSNNTAATLGWLGLAPDSGTSHPRTGESPTPTTASRASTESPHNFGRSQPGHPDGPYRGSHHAAEDSGIIDDTRPGFFRRLWNMLTGATQNCGQGVVDYLSSLYEQHGRSFRLGVAPSRKGVPARAVFEAVNSRADFATDYDEVERRLKAMPPGSSAVLASRWRGWRSGGHTYVARNIDGNVYLWDPHTGRLSGWPPHWGDRAVGRIAVGYLKADGTAADPLDGTPDELDAADKVGHVKGPQPGGERPVASSPVLAALNQRVPTGPTDLLVHDVVHDLADAERAEARARANVAWMARLSAGDAAQTRALIDALIDAHPFEIGNAWGIPEDISDNAIREWLDRQHARADQLRNRPKRMTPGQHQFVNDVGQLEASLREVDEAVEQAGLDPPRLLALNPAEFRGRMQFLGNGRAVIVIGDDPYSAERVSWHMGTERLDKLGETLIAPALEQLLLDQQETGSAAAIIWIGTGRGASDAFYSDLAAFRAAREALADAGETEPLTEHHVYNLRPMSLDERAAAASIRANPLWVPPEASPRVTAHGGGPFDRPEQTLAAYEESRRQGADAFEGDAQLTADQQLVLLHNPSVNKTSDGSGLVHKMTLEELRQLDFGVKHPSRALGEAQGDTRIMTVEQLLQFVAERDRQLTAVIETKHWIPNRNYFDLERRLADVLNRYGCANPAPGDQPRAVILSFWLESLAVIRRLAPGVPTVYHAPPLKVWAAVVASHYLAKAVGAAGIDHYFDTLRAYPEAADHARRLGLVVWARTKNERDAQYAKALGVAWMGSDHPGQTVQWLGRGSTDSDTMRLPPMPPANEFVHPIGKPQDAVGRARRNVDWLNRLAQSRTDQEMRDMIDALIDAHPYRIGNADGFLPADRDFAIREYLRRVVVRARAKLHGDQRLSEAARKHAMRANRIGLALWQLDHNAEKAGVGPPLMLAFDHREFGGDGRAVIGFGDNPYEADEVVWLIARQRVDTMGSVVRPAAEQLRQMRAAAPGKRVAVMVCVGNTTVPMRDSHTAFFSDLAAFRAVRAALAEIGQATPLAGNRVRALDFRAGTERAAQANTLWLHPDSDPLVFGHRGAKDLLPENTLAAFRLALEQGADALECDVQLSKDGQLVVLHDPMVNRTTEASGWVGSMTAAQLQELGVPTLAQLLDLVTDHNGPATLFIELKHYGPKDKNLESTLVDLLSSRKYRHLLNPRPDDQTRVAVHAMRKGHLQQIRDLAPNLPTVLLAPRLHFLWEVSLFLNRAKEAGANAVSLYETLRAFPEAVDMAHRQGLNVWAGVVHNAVEAQYLVDLGVDIIGSNNPGPTLDWIGLGPAEPTTPTTASRAGTESPNFGRSEPGHPDGPHRGSHHAAEDSGIIDDTRPGFFRRIWNMLTGATQNCGQGVVDYLSSLYEQHGRSFRLGVAPSRKGVPARAVFEAVNSRAHFATDYDEVERRLKAMPPGSSAVLASRWRGWRSPGHTYVARNIDGNVYLWDPHTGRLSGWPPHWGDRAVGRIAVGYLKADGTAVDSLDGRLDELDAADKVGHVKGPQPDDRRSPQGRDADREDVDVPLRLGADDASDRSTAAAPMEPDITVIIEPTALRLSHSSGESSFALGVAAEIQLGGSTDADLVIGSASVSPEHATIGSGREGQLWIRDNGSANGTWVNGDRLPPNHEYLLRDGDVIRLGDDEITIRLTHSGPEPVTVRLSRDGDVVPLRLTPGSETTLGRSEVSTRAGVFGEIEGMSDNHVSIGVTWDGRVWVRDNGTGNGTWINGQQISPGRKVPLYSRDTLTMGDFETTVTTEPEPAELIWFLRLPHMTHIMKIPVRSGVEVSLGSEESSALSRRIAEQLGDEALVALAGVAPNHATLGVTPEGEAWIRDNGSREGTQVDGDRCLPSERVDLGDKAKVTLGENGPEFAIRTHTSERPPLALRLVRPKGQVELEVPALTGLKLGSDSDSPLGGVRDIAPDHAWIGVHPDGYVWILDAGSGENTFVNNQLLVDSQAIPLHDGDVVSLGDYEFTVRFDEPARLQPEPQPVEIRMSVLGDAEPVRIDPGSDVMLGRAEGSPLRDLLSGHDAVAENHASIGVHPSGRVWIRDNGSESGTWVDGDRIEAGRKIRLRPGQRIRIGTLETTVEFAAPALPDIILVVDHNPETIAAVEDIALIPPAIYERIMEHLEAFSAGGVTLGSRPLDDLPGIEGMDPSGDWAGVYHWKYRRILVNTGVASIGSSTVLHEFGHAADDAYGDGIHPLSSTPEWTALNNEIQRIRRWNWRKRTKHYDKPEELFAEGFALWLLGDDALLDLVHGNKKAAAKLKEYYDRVFGPLE